MATSEEIKTYQIRITSGDQPNGVRASILLLDAKKFTIGNLVFLETGTPFPANYSSSGPVAYYLMAVYANVLDLLRNESPVYIQTDNHDEALIATSPEAIGDGDQVPTRLSACLNGCKAMIPVA